MNFMRIQNEELLLHYLARKDNRAFRHLYGVYFVALKSIAIRYVKDDQTACDLVQEVFISLLESTHRFISGDEVKYFLYSALKNRCVSYFRKQQVRDRYQRELLDTASEMGSFWEKVLEEDVYANLMAAIEQLPPQCRLVMQLTLEVLKISEIASRLRSSEDTVKEHKKNGKQKLARMVENPFLISLIFP